MKLRFWKAEETAEHVVYLYGPSWHHFGLRAKCYAEKRQEDEPISV